MVRLVPRRHLLYGLILPRHRPGIVALAGCLGLGGCSVMSVFWDSAEREPATTGSIAAAELAVEVQEPLPQRLAYSDAAKIGQSAAAALKQAEGGTRTDWINAATGSSGTLVDVKDDDTLEGTPAACRHFNTIVTSFTGVHRYSGRICSAGHGRPVVQLSETAPENPS